MPPSDPFAKKLPIHEIAGRDQRHDTVQTKPATQTEIMIHEMRTEMRDSFRSLGDTVLSIGQRVSSLEEAKRTHSGSLKRVSENDATQAAELASERLARTELAGKVDDLVSKLDKNNEMTGAVADKLLTEAKGFFKEHPALTYAIVTFITTALTTATAIVAARGH